MTIRLQTGLMAITLTLLAGAFAVVYLLSPTPVKAAADFRIIEVGRHDNQLLVEVEHFDASGDFDYFENYLWQGREGMKEPRVVNARGDLYLEDGEMAPRRRGPDGRRKPFRPDGREWLRTGTPYLDRESILGTIRLIHDRRKDWSNADWPDGIKRGQSRLIEKPVPFDRRDADGIGILVAKFRRLSATAYDIAADGQVLVYAGELPGVNPGLGQVEYGTVTTFYPSMDGQANISSINVTWSGLRGHNGDAAGDSDDQAAIAFQASTTTDQYALMARGFFLFNTAGIPDGDIISAATFGLTLGASSTVDDFSDSMSLVLSTVASDSGLVAADFQGTVANTTKQATDVSLASMTADDATYNNWTLNSTGLGNIEKAGITKFGIRATFDLADSPTPSWTSSGRSKITPNMAEELQPGDVRPRLVVTHSPPSAAITGTIGDGATEQEVRDGNGTIIITLTAATWAAAGATFNAQRQGIIDGIDSAQSETYGWNAEVRDKIGVSSVVRTADTIATVTISASEVADYRIDSNETLTVTVPAAAISIASDITATPTITITSGPESVAVSGTLGGSGGTPAEIRAGGETVILTLTDTKWVADGSTFNAERQAIIDGLDSNLADQDGWDARRTDFAVGDVVRTSDTIVTITLSASTAYAIPATETITAVVPASAVVYGEALTGTPTFNIVPTFVLTGNRVTGPIDLSAITNVAYCAIGWEATTPAATSVTVETSVDGGGVYSAATNGECPTGITVGSDLSTITDARIRVSLTTSDNTATPLVEGIGLLIQDTGAPALYYQLNTVPGITITDRSANSNTGTMSFPTSQTGINSTTGVLESTRSSLSLEQLLSVGDIVSPVTGAAASGNIFNQTESGFGSLPFQSMMQTMATGGELPLKFVWVVAIGLFSIALGVVALHLTGSLMISGVGMGAGLSVGAAIGAGLIPGWTVILFVILALALIVMRSRGALPL